MKPHRQRSKQLASVIVLSVWLGLGGYACGRTPDMPDESISNDAFLGTTERSFLSRDTFFSDETNEFDTRITSGMNEGLKQQEAGNYWGAIATYDSVLKQVPDSATALNNRAFSKLHVNDYEGALEDFNRALEIDPNYYLAYNNRALIFSQYGHYERALEDIDASIALNPNVVESHLSRGALNNSLRRLHEAIDDYSNVITLTPGDPAGYKHRGITLFHATQFHKAKLDFEKALEIYRANHDSEGAKDMGLWSANTSYWIERCSHEELCSR